MAANFNYQNVKVNIIDVETQRVIRKDFNLHIYNLSLNWLIRGGSDIMCSISADSMDDYTVELIEMQEYGYEWALPDGYRITVDIETDENGNSKITLPDMLNLYLRKVN